MSKVKTFLFVILFTIYLMSCAESNTATELEVVTNYRTELEKFFPVNVGNAFTYSVDSLNLTSKNYENIGRRVFSVNDKVSDGQRIILNAARIMNLLVLSCNLNLNLG